MSSLPTISALIHRIDSLAEDAFENFVQINELSLSRNPIRAIGKSPCDRPLRSPIRLVIHFLAAEDYAFRRTKVSHLDLKDCELESIGTWAWTGLEKELKSLDLSGNAALQAKETNFVIFYNDSFNNLESLSRFHMDGIGSADRHSGVIFHPLSLLSSQFSLQDFSIKHLLDPEGRKVPFDPAKYE